MKKRLKILFAFNSIVLFHSNSKSAPKFLLDVYKNLNDEANENAYGGRHARSTDFDEGENFITNIDKAAIRQSDIITTFLNKSTASFLCVLKGFLCFS